MTERTYGGYTLAELRALCVGATPGPWYALPADFKKWVTTAGVTDTEWRLNHDADAAFVAATREALPDLLDRVAALEAALRQVVDVLTATAQRSTGYDWNADYDYMTLRQSEAFAAARAALGNHDDR